MFKNKLVYLAIAVLTVFGLVGWSAAQNDTSKVDGATLESLYQAAFHRSADDEGKGFHLGRNLKDVLRDFNNSHEMRYYGALFKAVKSYEEAQRAPGTLTEEEKQKYLDLIDSSLATLLSWVATLQDRPTCTAIVGAEEARAAIKAAYDGMSPAARAAAEKGVFNALKHIGAPDKIAIRNKCNVSPTSIPAPTSVPSTPAPSSVSTPAPPTPTPSPVPPTQ